MNNKLIKAIKSTAWQRQLDVIRDIMVEHSRRVAIFVPRRGAKTTAVVLLFIMCALAYKNIRLIFIGLTGETAENAFLPHALKAFAQAGLEEDIDYSYNLTERTFTFFSTNSTIHLKGFDMSYKEMDKILGGNAFGVAIDEAQSHTQDLEQAILKKIQPAVSDYIPVGGGFIILLGTAGDLKNFWYKMVTTPNHLGWSFHQWDAKENPFMAEAKEIEEQDFLAQYGPGYKEEDWYQQQYLNQWVFNSDSFCYHYDTTLNTVTELPIITSASWQHFCGMDLGFEDDNAWVIYAQNKYSPHLYIVETHRQNHMNVFQIMDMTLAFHKKYKLQSISVDTGGGGKTIAETMKLPKYLLPIEAAIKTGDKKSRIATMNGYLQTGRIKVLPNNQDLIDEWQTLKWDPKRVILGEWKEDERFKNHLGDAALYGFTKTYPYLSKEEPKPQFPHSDFFYKVQKQDRQRDHALRKTTNYHTLIKRG